ncbi:MAG: transposase [Mangrovibacterium sp.]
MQFEPTHVYNVYNRGNNSQQIFFSRENYLYFLNKIRTYVVPFADILAWCLMPNHFHLMLHVNRLEIPSDAPAASSQRISDYKPLIHQVTSSHQVNPEKVNHPMVKTRNLNQSIAIVLRSYTRALQIQQKFTGSLFQHRTKSICLTEINGLTPAWFHSAFGAIINVPDSEKEYSQVCFNYIHHNPVSANLVKYPADWEFSSYPDYAGLRDGRLINRNRAKELGLHL